MNKALYKDLSASRIILLAVLVATVMYSFIFQSGPYVAFMFAAFIGIAVISASIDMENKSGWCRFAISSGVSRKEVLNSKFVLALVTVAVGQVVALFTALLMVAVLDYTIELETTLQFMAISSVMGLAFNSIFILIAYRFRGLLVYLVALVVGLFIAVVLFASKELLNFLSDNELIIAALCAILLVMALIGFISSHRVVEKLDF